MTEYEGLSNEELIEEYEETKCQYVAACVEAIDSYIMGDLNTIEEADEWGDVEELFMDVALLEGLVRDRGYFDNE